MNCPLNFLKYFCGFIVKNSMFIQKQYTKFHLRKNISDRKNYIFTKVKGTKRQQKQIIFCYFILKCLADISTNVNYIAPAD